MTIWLASLGFALYTAALFYVAGRRVRSRARERQERVARILTRVGRRCAVLMLAGTALSAGVLLLDPPRLGDFSRSALIYLLPLGWVELYVLGTSWLELQARGIQSGLWRFHRFNLFSAFLLHGQRLPFVSAALAAPADLSRVGSVMPAMLLHIGVATLLWAVLRRLIVRWLVPHQEISDDQLLADVREVAAREGISLGPIRLVATERGQSVNAIAATTSGSIYVAEGLRDGLGHEELKAVLLHEVGHLGQRKTNAFRHVASFFIPVAIWLVRGVPGLDLSGGLSFAIVAGVLGAALLWNLLVRSVDEGSERRADRFADRQGTPGALASALAKMYAHDLRRHPGLAARLERAGEEATV